jgi:hypothetical protein
LTNFSQRVSPEAKSLDERLRYLSGLGVDHGKAWWRASFERPKGGTSMAQKVVDMAVECEQIDTQTNQALANRAQLAAEHVRIAKAGQAVAGFAKRRAELARQVAMARQTIANFDQANSPLFEAVRQEAEVIPRDQ